MVLGRYWGARNWKRTFEKTRVGFGRTEVSVRLDGIFFCALSFGHGPGGLGFYGGSSGTVFCIFCLGGTGGIKSDTSEKVFLQKLGSDLAV